MHTMKFEYHNKFLLITIITLLLIGQSGLLVHATEHPFHHPDESCQTFISLEQSDETLLDYSERLISGGNFLTINFFNSYSSYSFQAVYLIRAPPFHTAS